MSIDHQADDKYDLALQQFLRLKHDLIDIKHAVKRAGKTNDYSHLAKLFEKARSTAATGRSMFE